jgi:vanillate/3-O-methylgallate O-demethylase
MTKESLEKKIQDAGGSLELMRNLQVGEFSFPIPSEITNWRDEQRKWVDESILYDISLFGCNMFFKGPDVKKLFTETAVNNFSKFGKNKAKQLVVVNYEGYLIDDSILFALEDDEYVSVGSQMAPNWIRFHAERDGYDVQITEEGPIEKRLFRFIVQGPTALEAIRKASGGTLPDIRFFGIDEFTIGGFQVHALNHTMSGIPGDAKSGLEIYGPFEYAEEVKTALLEAGKEFGLQEGGAESYPTSTVESGWLGMPVPAIFSGPQYLEYREWLDENCWEANSSLGGSFVTENVEDYYVTPYELGLGKTVNFDHEFIGKKGLLERREDQTRTKVWLVWNNEDVTRVIASSLFDETPAKYLAIPTPNYSSYNYDAVQIDGETIGWSGWSAYTVNMGHVASLAVVDLAHAQDGKEVTLIWGEPNGGSARPGVERHKQSEIRATIHTTPPPR